jgi:anti-sigma-K factor RskA
MTTVGLVAAAAVAVGVVVIGPGVLPDDPVEPIAAATLEPFGDHQVQPASGQVVRTADGHKLLELDLSALPALEGDFYEVWLLDDRDGRLISLGPVRPDGTYALPPGVQVGDFPLVDVSIEPPDGDPTHSGNSVLRGPLST